MNRDDGKPKVFRRTCTICGIVFLANGTRKRCGGTCLRKICKCGCGLKTKPGNTYIHGHSMRGKKRPLVQRKKYSRAAKKRFASLASRKAHSVLMKNWVIANPKKIERHSRTIRRLWRKKEFRTIQLSKMHTKKAEERRSASLKAFCATEKGRRLRREVAISTWKVPSIRAKRLAKARQCPNGDESRMINILHSLKLNFDFQGDIPNVSYVPDFILPKSNVIIEVDGWHHFTKEGKERDALRNLVFKNAGYTVLHFPCLWLRKKLDFVVKSIIGATRKCA